MDSLKLKTASARATDASGFLSRVYGWMCGALAITGIVAYGTLSLESIQHIIFNPWVFIPLLVIELISVIVLVANIEKMSLNTASIMLLAYSFLNGVTLSIIFSVYSTGSIVQAFLVTAAMFAAMASYGMFTGKDLSGWGRWLFGGLIGIIIAMVANMFLQNSMFDFWISVAGVFIFLGLTAYDNQKLKEIGFQMEEGESKNKQAILGALSLYLDFINLFLFILRLMGGSSKD